MCMYGNVTQQNANYNANLKYIPKLKGENSFSLALCIKQCKLIYFNDHVNWLIFFLENPFQAFQFTFILSYHTK